MDHFKRQLYSFPLAVQKFIIEPCVDNIQLYTNTFDVNCQCTYDGSTLLMMICQYCYYFNPLKYIYYIPHGMEKIKWLLARGADPDKQDYRGFTALMSAARFSSPKGLTRKQCINALYKRYKIDPVKQNINKNIYFMIAASLQKTEKYENPKSSEKIIRILLEHRANPNIETFNGYTALMIAACHSSPEKGESSERTVEILLKGGADPDIQTFGGETALMMAASQSSSHDGKSSEKTVEILLKGEANPIISDTAGWTASMHAKNPNVKQMIRKFMTFKF